MNFKNTIGIGLVMGVCSLASASGVGDIAGFDDAPRTYNDRPDSSLTFMSSYNPAGSNVSLHEENYGMGGFANRHIAWFDNGAGSRVDFNYGDGWDMQMTMQVNQADNVGNVEAGFQSDLFGLGLFGVLTGNGEVVCFGSVLPFFSFGSGLYNVGDEIMLRMIHRPGDMENGMVDSTMEYMYNNLTTGSGWVSSGLVAFTTGEGGIPSSFDMFNGVGAQISAPSENGVVDINFSNITTAVPAPGVMAMLSFGGLAAARRRR